jgi:hypothetical protein
VQALKNGPVILIDPLYHENIRRLSDYLALKESEGIAFVDVPEEERHLNPANMAFTPDGKLIIPHAPLTRKALINAGVRSSHILMLPQSLEEALISIFLLSGGIGCLVGQKVKEAL